MGEFYEPAFARRGRCGSDNYCGRGDGRDRHNFLRRNDGSADAYHRAGGNKFVGAFVLVDVNFTDVAFDEHLIFEHVQYGEHEFVEWSRGHFLPHTA